MDPDTTQVVKDVADQAGNNTGMLAGFGAVLGSAYLYVSRRVGSTRVVEALREEMGATRNTMRVEGDATRKELGELGKSVAHLAGQIDGMRR